MNKKKIFFLFCLLAFTLIVQGQKKNFGKEECHISGSIKGYNSGILEMTFEAEGNEKFQKKYTTTFDSTGLFSFNLPYPNTVGDRIGLTARPKNIPAFFVFSSIIEPNDKVEVSIKKLDSNFNVTFSGKGSLKYKCANEIDKARKSFDEIVVKMPNNSGNVNYSIDDTIVAIRKTCETYRAALPFKILERYKNKLNPVVYKIMQYDVEGIARGRCLSHIMTLYSDISQSPDVKRFDKVFKLFKATFNHVEDTADANLKVFSSSYVGSHLFGKVFYGLLMERSVIENKLPVISSKDIYTEIRQNYRAPLGDYLIILALNSSNKLAPLSSETLDSLWKDAYEIISTPSLKNYVGANVNHKSKGKDAFKFALPDVNGNIVRLEDFKGKVVLIDFWFTGCAGCAGYVRTLKRDVYPKFKNDSNVVFISISGDVNRNTWVKSVGTGVYSGPGFIDLYTEGKGFEHPLTKYYDFNGGPHSLLIDKNGKIFHGNPPTMDSDSLINLIEEALVK